VQGPDGSMQWRGRHVGLEIPVAQLDVKRLVIIGENGQPIPHKDPEAFASTLKSGKPGIYLKLFIERPPGFKFKLRAE
jgi:dienelactone hydrolase